MSAKYLDIKDIRNRREEKSIEKSDNTENKEEVNKEFKTEDKKDYKTLEDKYIRVCADLDNLEKRIIENSKKDHEKTVAEIFNSFLPLIDSINEMEYNRKSKDKVIEGIQMIKEQLKSILNDIGIEEINDAGMIFNPRYNEAVSVSNDEQYSSKQIVKVLRKGYKFKHKIIRPSLVEIKK